MPNRAYILECLPEEIVANILHLVCQPPARLFAKEHAVQHYAVALVCADFARLLRQPLPVYERLHIDAKGLHQQCSHVLKGVAGGNTRAQSFNLWLQAGRSFAVKQMVINSLRAGSAQAVFQPVAAGLEDLRLSKCPQPGAQFCLDLIGRTCKALTSLVMKVPEAPLPDTQSALKLAELSGLCGLEKLHVACYAVTDLEQPFYRLAKLTRLWLGTLTSLQGLSCLSKLQCLSIAWNTPGEWTDLIPSLPCLSEITALCLGSNPNLSSLDLTMLPHLRVMMLQDLPSLHFIKVGQCPEDLELSGNFVNNAANSMNVLLDALLQRAVWPGRLSQLKTIRLAHSDLSTVTSQFALFRGLQNLVCHDCCLSEVPSPLARLPLLSMLSIINNRCNLEVLPEHLVSLAKLTRLQLSTFGLYRVHLPQGLGELHEAGTAVAELEVHGSRLKQLRRKLYLQSNLGFISARALSEL